MEQLFEVIFEDADLLVVNKPADLVVHPTKGDEYSSLISRARLFAKQRFTPYIINRLDRETSGIVVIAKSPETAGELGKKFEARAVQKEYLAIVHGFMEGAGTIDAPLGKDESSRVVVKDCVRPDGIAAQTDWALMQRFENSYGQFSLVQVAPRSGRKHQIRIHLQSVGHPIVGDKLYGGDEDCYLALVEGRLTPEHQRKLILPYQALHASKLHFSFRGRDLTFSAEPESWFQSFVDEGNHRQ